MLEQISAQQKAISAQLKEISVQQKEMARYMKAAADAVEQKGGAVQDKIAENAGNAECALRMRSWESIQTWILHQSKNFFPIY